MIRKVKAYDCGQHLHPSYEEIARCSHFQWYRAMEAIMEQERQRGFDGCRLRAQIDPQFARNVIACLQAIIESPR